MHTTALETCANCGLAIGNLEQAHVWKNQVVCAPCHARLPGTLAYATPAGKPPPLPGNLPTGPWIICPNPNCRYRGASHKIPRGSTWVELLLLLCGIIPGIIYSAWFRGVSIYCPCCGGKIRDE